MTARSLDRPAIARLLADPTWELIPLRNARDQAAFLPPGSTVSVTASPAKGLDATLDLAIELERAGHRAIPHLSARMVRDDHHLAELLARMAEAGIDRVFVVGGDEPQPGAYEDALSLLEAMADLGILPREVGVGCYPQGHPLIPEDRLLAALHAKARYATAMTSQLCFDPGAVGSWLAERRNEGLSLPLRIGIPGVAEIPRLLSISARIGVRDASRFVLKNRRFVGELLRSGGLYRPTGLVEDLSQLTGEPAARVVGLHVYTFNNVGPTVDWYRGLASR
ncbi:MAG TPA: methylenetetrahydrofolate reductase [Candidatus Binatus sp.]|nr:methylenetetrahydrofolate reductase [Candidatus Binatus sp.]